MERGVLVTGGAGYIGSHAVKHLLNDGKRVVVVDNLDRGNPGAIDALRAIAPNGPGQLHFEEMDILETDRLQRLLAEQQIDSVLHFAALAYVRESVDRPDDYRRVNVDGMRSLLDAIASVSDTTTVRKFVFSSSCATYGAPDPSLIPIKEDCPQKPINPYGDTKLECERMLLEFQDSHRDVSIAILRYFNVAGADMDGLLGEHHVPETHIIPLIIQTALGRRESFTIFGTDLPTEDGTCVRDYIHVDDLARAHLHALLGISQEANSGHKSTHPNRWIYNLGIGRPYSIREIIDSVERVTGETVPAIDGPANPADPPILCADPKAFQVEQGWRPEHTSIDTIVESACNWMRDHPNGYE